MKYIKTIEILSERAERLGYAKLLRRQTPVYEITKDENIIILKHYGTETIVYDKGIHELLHWYGESVSDRDSMNTLLNYLGEHRYSFRYGSRIGFIMEVQENGERLQMSRMHGSQHSTTMG